MRVLAYIGLFTFLLGGAGIGGSVSDCARGVSHIKYDANLRVEACTEAIVAGHYPNGGLSWAYINRAIAYFNLGYDDLAMEDYTEALLLDPANSRTYNQRANLFADSDQFERAIEDYNEALRIDPTFTYAYRNRALFSRRLCDDAAAFRDIVRDAQISGPYRIKWWKRYLRDHEKLFHGEIDGKLASMTLIAMRAYAEDPNCK